MEEPRVRGKPSKVGAVRWSPNGYQYTRTKHGWELTHRLIAEKTLGRKMKPTERVRFKDNNRKNLDPDNIEVYETSKGTPHKKRARIEARIAELQAELEDLGG
jgi:hypothetical protein